MRKILALICGLSISASSLIAQAVEFIEPRNIQNVPEADFFTYKVGDNVYVLQKKYRMMAPVSFDLQLDAYDANRKPIGSNVIDKTLEMGDANLYEGFYPLKDKLVMFKSEYSKASGTKMLHLYYYVFDAAGKRGKKNLVASIDAESAGNSGSFNMNVSPDGTKVAVISELPYEKEGMESCRITVYDNSFKQLWKKEYTFSYESSKTPKNDIFINNSGTVFILKQINLKKEFDKYSVFSFLADGKTVVEKKLDLGNGFMISTYKELFRPNGDLVIAGYSYMNKKIGVNVEKPDGYFYIDINANGELNASKLHTMKNNYAVAAQVLLMPDNTVCLTGEHRSTASTLSRDKPGQYINSYSYGDIYITKFAADGSAAWDYTAKRDLKSVSDGGRFLASYTWLNGDDINLLFADYANQHDDKKRMIEFGGNRIDLIQTIGSDGKFKSEAVIMDPRIGGKRGDYYFIPVTGSLYKDKKIFMLAARQQELVGATISY